MYCTLNIVVLEYSRTGIRAAVYAVYTQLSGVLDCDLSCTLVIEPCFVLRFMQYRRNNEKWTACYELRVQIDGACTARNAVHAPVAPRWLYLHTYLFDHLCLTIIYYKKSYEMITLRLVLLDYLFMSSYTTHLCNIYHITTFDCMRKHNQKIGILMRTALKSLAQSNRSILEEVSQRSSSAYHKKPLSIAGNIYS